MWMLQLSKVDLSLPIFTPKKNWTLKTGLLLKCTSQMSNYNSKMTNALGIKNFLIFQKAVSHFEMGQ